MSNVSSDAAQASARRTRASLRAYIGENAVTTLIFSLGTGGYMAGLLSWMGASPAVCALVGAFPQLGCMMQLVSPFLFEHLRRRKTCIVACCFAFRFLVGCAGVIPLLFSGTRNTVVTLYLVAFLIAGFVTPGLNQWIMDLAPVERRGSFFARRDIISSVINATVVLLMGRLVDGMIASGRTREGYLIVFVTLVILSMVDALLLSRMEEATESPVIRLKLADLARPLRDKRFFPVFVFIVLWFFTQNLSSGFLAVYQLTVLGLDYSMIALITAVASAASMAASWFWGRVADKLGWKRLLVYASSLMALSCTGWFLLPVRLAFLAPVIQCLTSAGTTAYGLSNLNIQYIVSPPEGKTAFLGVTAAASNLAGYAAVLLGSQIQPLLAQIFSRAGIPLLFAASAVGFTACALFSRRIADV